MIRTLVVDDDYHVAHAHALSVGRVPGFVVVGEAHSVAEAESQVAATAPDLILLDQYLPDGSGLDVMRLLTIAVTDPAPRAGAPGARPAAPPSPDFIMVTAARDIDSVRAAMQLGAVHFLVKPFTFGALREQLLAYQQWHTQLRRLAVADQRAVDDLYRIRLAAHGQSPARNLPTTMGRVLELVQRSSCAVTAAEVAEQLQVSRPTAQRYLATLVRRDLLQLDLSYGRAGRPEHLYRARGR